MGEMRKVYKILVGKTDGKSPLARPGHTWENNITTDFKRDRVGECGLDPSGSGERQMMGSCEHSNGLVGPIKGGEFLA
jgi:hypothetical protein